MTCPLDATKCFTESWTIGAELSRRVPKDSCQVWIPRTFAGAAATRWRGPCKGTGLPMVVEFA